MAGKPSEATLVGTLVAVQVLFGGLAVAGKLVFAHIEPLGLALFRLAVGGLVLFALERILVRSPLPSRGDLARFAGLALLGVVLNQGLFLAGLARTTATNAILLIATIPAFTLLVATLLRHEKASPMRLGGIGLAFGGVLVLVAGGLDLGGARLLGNVMIVANALSSSAYLVLSRPMLARHDPLTLTAWVFLLGALEMALVATPSALRADWGRMDPGSWVAFAYVLLGATVLAYGLNNWVLHHASASRVASFVYLQPLVGVALAVLLLGEALQPRALLAGLLILGGVALANRARPSLRAGQGA